MLACDGCRNGDVFPTDFTMAFQPIVDLAAKRIWGYEALVRG
ncbi:MAG: EAL domain-containing protein, partial [Sphingobacteriales bacterium]